MVLTSSIWCMGQILTDVGTMTTKVTLKPQTSASLHNFWKRAEEILNLNFQVTSLFAKRHVQPWWAFQSAKIHLLRLLIKFVLLLTDESAFYMDAPPNYTYEQAGSQRVEVGTSGKEKVRISCLFCFNSSGQKLSILCVLPGNSGFEEVQWPANVIPVYSTKGTINTEVLIEHFVRRIWTPFWCRIASKEQFSSLTELLATLRCSFKRLWVGQEPLSASSPQEWPNFFSLPMWPFFKAWRPTTAWNGELSELHFPYLVKIRQTCYDALKNSVWV